MKNILRIIISFTIIWFHSLYIIAQNKIDDRPNIIWITIEDTSPHFIGCYGNKSIKTPNIDQLAREGIRFTNAFSTNTVCAPSRFTMLTGVHSSTAGTGNHRSHYKIPDQITGFPYLLKMAGYYTSNQFKTDYNLANEKSMIAKNWDESSQKADFKNRSAGQPFFSVYNFNDSHQSRTMTNPRLWYIQNVFEEIPEAQRFKVEDVDLPPFYRDTPEMREQMVRLYNSLFLTDVKVGKLIDRLKEEGIYENTIIVFFSDHGQGMPGFKTHASSLGHRVPFIVRVPAKYKHLWADVEKPENHNMLDFLDLAPTMLNLAGVAVPEYMKGTMFNYSAPKANSYFFGSRDNTDEVIDLGRTITKDSLVYVRHYYPHLPIMQKHKYMDVSDIMHQIRRDQQEGKLNAIQSCLISAPREAEMLFNIKQDPWETENLVNHSVYKNELNELRKANQNAILANKDVMFAPEYVLAKVNEHDTLYHFGQNPVAYPLKRILEAAEMVGKGKVFLKKQQNLLQDENSVLRYWAVIGLRNQSKNVLDEKWLINVFAKEQEQFVKIELAALLVHHFNNETARTFILNGFGEENSTLVRQSLRAVINTIPINQEVAELSLALRKKMVSQPFKTLNYEINSCIDLIRHTAGLEKLTNEK